MHRLKFRFSAESKLFLCRSPDLWIIASALSFPTFLSVALIKARSPNTVAGPRGTLTRFPLSSQTGEHKTHIQLHLYCSPLQICSSSVLAKKHYFNFLFKTNRRQMIANAVKAMQMYPAASDAPLSPVLGAPGSWSSGSGSYVSSFISSTAGLSLY